jgi:hypothetical protein
MSSPSAYENLMVQKCLDEYIISKLITQMHAFSLLMLSVEHTKILHSTLYPIQSVWNVIFEKDVRGRDHFVTIVVVQSSTTRTEGHIVKYWSFRYATKKEALKKLLEDLQMKLAPIGWKARGCGTKRWEAARRGESDCDLGC